MRKVLLATYTTVACSRRSQSCSVLSVPNPRKIPSSLCQQSALSDVGDSQHRAARARRADFNAAGYTRSLTTSLMSDTLLKDGSRAVIMHTGTSSDWIRKMSGDGDGTCEIIVIESISSDDV